MNAPVFSEIKAYSSKKGTQREYENVLILRPEQNKQQIAEFLDAVRSILSSQNSSLLEIDNWGMRTLAFPIRHCKRGIYVYLRFLGGSDTVQELERKLRIREDVIRFLTARVDDDVDPSARPSSVDDAALDAASVAAPDPVEIMRAKEEEERKARAAAEAAAAEAAEAARAAASESASSGGDQAEASSPESSADGKDSE